LAITTGADWIDYLIADNFVIPPESMQYYSEKLILLPHSYHPFSHKGYYPIKNAPPRQNIGLPEDKILFCNHQGANRIDLHILKIWATILNKTHNTGMVFKGFNQERIKNIRQEFRNLGITATDDSDSDHRIYFMFNAAKDDHIAQKSTCDIYLDVTLIFFHSLTFSRPTTTTAIPPPEICSGPLYQWSLFLTNQWPVEPQAPLPSPLDSQKCK